MSSIKYPEGIDAVWLGRDKVGHVAAFITAGLGPVPRWIEFDDDSLTKVELQISNLPSISDVSVAGCAILDFYQRILDQRTLKIGRSDQFEASSILLCSPLTLSSKPGVRC